MRYRDNLASGVSDGRGKNMKSADGRFEYQNKDGDPLPDGSSLDQVGRFSFVCRSHDDGRHCSVNIKSAGYIEQGIFLNTNKKREAKQ